MPETIPVPFSNIAVGALTRAPSTPGKTRLARDLTPERLASLRRALLADAIDLLARTPDIDRFIFCTPADEASLADVADLAGPRMPVLAQRGDDLGARMCAAAEDLIEGRGYEVAILIGTDNPLLTPAHVAEAIELLQHDTIALGPADDGGYYLIGMRRLRRELFAGVAWGTESVLTDTLRIADRIGAEARLIRSGYDVDTIADVRRLEGDLCAAPSDSGVHVRGWFRAHS